MRQPDSARVHNLTREKSMRRGIEALLSLASDEALAGGLRVKQMSEMLGHDKSQISLGERAHLPVLQGPRVLTLLSEARARAIETVGWVGRVFPAYCTSCGRALLLDHTRNALRRLFRGTVFEPLSPNTVASVDELFEKIQAERVHGYATVDEEFEAGLVAVAVPVRGPQSRIIAAVNISAPNFRFGDRLHEGGTEVRVCVAAVERAVTAAHEPESV